ncbi:GNAT family N-acetyltransferase [Paenibacillus antri]|uniref:GNAT family N-acetyltransferase n=1 Tax=Paenibacillus antri TaxID=2582848 RepID=A0A5R9G9C5_9BACL|nr:GNAT family N-acetyltransferase [Paenibacillus antri]TLS49674.1 GNAT family N-acetyltransferase [Paenibacillus antri]
MHPTEPIEPTDASEYMLTPMTERDAAEICEWRYPAPYDIYQWPAWGVAVREGRDFADPALRERHYRAVRRDGRLCGFAQWLPLVAEDGPPVVRLGLGLHPDDCGSGRGAGFAAFLARETAALHSGCVVDLEVEKDNVRAIRAYERAGFRAVDEYELPIPGRGAGFVVNMIYLPLARS